VQKPQQGSKTEFANTTDEKMEDMESMTWTHFDTVEQQQRSFDETTAAAQWNGWGLASQESIR